MLHAHASLYGRLPIRKDRFRCDGQADCSFVSGLSVRGFLPAGPDGICRSAPYFLCGLLAPRKHAGLADRGLTCLPSHFVVPCAIFQRPPPSSFVGSCFLRQPRLCRLADEVRLVRPVMGQQGPDRARRLVGQGDRDHVMRPPLGEAQRPLWRRLCMDATRACRHRRWMSWPVPLLPLERRARPFPSRYSCISLPKQMVRSLDWAVDCPSNLKALLSAGSVLVPGRRIRTVPSPLARCLQLVRKFPPIESTE